MLIKNFELRHYSCGSNCIESVWPDKNHTNVNKSCPKMVSLEKGMILTLLQ